MGRIGKAHGVGGDVTVVLSTNRVERVETGSQLTTGGGRQLVVAAARPHQQRFIVTFEGVHTREQAEELRGDELFAPPLDDPDELWVHELIGAEVFELDGTRRGVVEAILDNPASDLLVLDSGAMVPARFVTAVDPGVRVDVDAPAGLFEGAEEAR
ncbi:MAG: ribosome maturation factor RimM [Acidimicrobiales bacterium]